MLIVLLLYAEVIRVNLVFRLEPVVLMVPLSALRVPIVAFVAVSVILGLSLSEVFAPLLDLVTNVLVTHRFLKFTSVTLSINMLAAWKPVMSW